MTREGRHESIRWKLASDPRFVNSTENDRENFKLFDVDALEITTSLYSVLLSLRWNVANP